MYERNTGPIDPELDKKVESTREKSNEVIERMKKTREESANITAGIDKKDKVPEEVEKEPTNDLK
jgi:hypothetical protein